MRFLSGLFIHTWRKHESNITSIWYLRQNCKRQNNALKNKKALVHSPKGDTDFFDIVGGVLRGDTICIYNLLSLPTTNINIDKSNKR